MSETRASKQPRKQAAAAPGVVGRKPTKKERREAAWKAYLAVVKAAWKAFDAAVKPARETCEAVVKAARETYLAVVKAIKGADE